MMGRNLLARRARWRPSTMTIQRRSRSKISMRWWVLFCPTVWTCPRAGPRMRLQAVAMLCYATMGIMRLFRTSISGFMARGFPRAAKSPPMRRCRRSPQLPARCATRGVGDGNPYSASMRDCAESRAKSACRASWMACWRAWDQTHPSVCSNHPNRLSSPPGSR